MRKLFGVFLVSVVLFGVVGSAFAESGPIWPFGTTTSSSKVKPMENKIIWPW